MVNTTDINIESLFDKSDKKRGNRTKKTGK
jgi:hypothetical protein